MDKLKERIACAVVSFVVGIIIAFALTFWVDWSVIHMLVIIPPACAVAGFIAGDKAVEVFKDIASHI